MNTFVALSDWMNTIMTKSTSEINGVDGSNLSVLTEKDNFIIKGNRYPQNTLSL